LHSVEQKKTVYHVLKTQKNPTREMQGGLLPEEG